MKLLVSSADPAWTPELLITHFLNFRGSMYSVFKQPRIGNNLLSTTTSTLQHLRTWLSSGSDVCAVKARQTVGAVTSPKTMTEKQGCLLQDNLSFPPRLCRESGKEANPAAMWHLFPCLVTNGPTTVPRKGSNHKPWELSTMLKRAQKM